MARKTLLHLHCPLQATDPVAQRIASIGAAFDLKHKYPNLAMINTTELTQSNWTKRGDDAKVMQYLWLRRGELYTYFGGGVDTKRNQPNVSAGNANGLTYDRGLIDYKAGTGECWKLSSGLAGVSPTRVAVHGVWTVPGTPAAFRWWGSHLVDGFETGRAPKSFRKSAYYGSLVNLRRIIQAGTIPSIGSLDANHTRFPDLLNVKGDVFSSAGPTHGNRKIDFTVGYRMGPQRGKDWQITMGGSKLLQLPYNDHRSVLTEFHIDY